MEAAAWRPPGSQAEARPSPVVSCNTLETVHGIFASAASTLGINMRGCAGGRGAFKRQLVLGLQLVFGPAGARHYHADETLQSRPGEQMPMWARGSGSRSPWEAPARAGVAANPRLQSPDAAYTR